MLVLIRILARKCLRDENGGKLLQSLSKQAKNALGGVTLSLSNMEQMSSKLPDKDKHLLIPPTSLPNSSLYDIMHILQLGRSPGQSQDLFIRLILKYYDMDRNLRVSSVIVIPSLIQFVPSVRLVPEPGNRYKLRRSGDTERIFNCRGPLEHAKNPSDLQRAQNARQIAEQFFGGQKQLVKDGNKIRFG